MADTVTFDADTLRDMARQFRLDILDITTKAGSGHPSSSFSCVEIVTALFFGGILRYRPHDPWWPVRDRFIMSKGHAAPLLYPVLARAGYFDRELIYSLRQLDSPVQGHPIQGCLPGVEATTGSLGQGLSLGIGHLLGARLNGHDYRVYVLLGDGECQAGQIWEAAMAAEHFRLGRLHAILDYNKYQETGPIAREMALEPLAEKRRSFGWHVEEANGRHRRPDRQGQGGLASRSRRQADHHHRAHDQGQGRVFCRGRLHVPRARTQTRTGAEMTRSVPAGDVVTWADVKLDEASAVVQLRRQQDAF